MKIQEKRSQNGHQNKIFVSAHGFGGEFQNQEDCHTIEKKVEDGVHVQSITVILNILQGECFCPQIHFIANQQ